MIHQKKNHISKCIFILKNKAKLIKISSIFKELEVRVYKVIDTNYNNHISMNVTYNTYYSLDTIGIKSHRDVVYFVTK